MLLKRFLAIVTISAGTLMGQRRQALLAEYLRLSAAEQGVCRGTGGTRHSLDAQEH